MKKVAVMFVVLVVLFGVMVCSFAQKAQKAALKKEGQKIETKVPPVPSAPIVSKKADAAKSKNTPKIQKKANTKTKKNIKAKTDITPKR